MAPRFVSAISRLVVRQSLIFFTSFFIISSLMLNFYFFFQFLYIYLYMSLSYSLLPSLPGCPYSTLLQFHSCVRLHAFACGMIVCVERNAIRCAAYIVREWGLSLLMTDATCTPHTGIQWSLYTVSIHKHTISLREKEKEKIGYRDTRWIIYHRALNVGRTWYSCSFFYFLFFIIILFDRSSMAPTFRQIQWHTWPCKLKKWEKNKYKKKIIK